MREQTGQATPNTSAVHVTAEGGNLESRRNALVKALLGQGHERLLDNLVGQGLPVVHIADLTRHLTEYLLVGIRKVVMVEQTSIRLLDKLAGGSMETHVVEAVERSLRSISAVAVGTLLLRLALHVITVSGIESLGVAGQREVAVENRVLAGEVGLVKVVGVLHVGTPQTGLGHNRGVRANKHGDATGTTSGPGIALSIEGNVSSNDDSISTIPGRRLNPVHGVKESVGTTVAGVDGIDTLNASVVPEQLHQDGLDGLGLVENRLGTDLEAANGVRVDVVVLEKPGDGGQSKGVNVCKQRGQMSVTRYTHARTHTPAIMEDYGYEVAAVKATRVPSGNIDKTFRSGYIGK